MLQIEVRDSGKGFAADEQEKIAADLRRFNGRDLKGEGTPLCLPWFIFTCNLRCNVDFIRKSGPGALDCAGDSQTT